MYGTGGPELNIAVRHVLLCLSLLSALPVLAVDWQKPTQEELSMTSQPEVPGADAVYLYREETTQDRDAPSSPYSDVRYAFSNFQSVYVRLKILTEAGKKYGDVSFQYDSRVLTPGLIEGRTIHSDGSVIPFTGKPYTKLVEKSGSYESISETRFSMPDVQIGSILEYRYFLRYPASYFFAAHWYVQQELFIRDAHYFFLPSNEAIDAGHDKVVSGVEYTTVLPPGLAVRRITTKNAFDLTTHNVMPLPDEEYSPPLHSLSQRVLFYYTAYHTPGDFWSKEGKYWSKAVDEFTASPKLKAVVAKIVDPADTERQKVNKIYDAVMTLENTSFTRQHSEAENKAEHVKIRTADDIWEQKRGYDDEIALLFIGMVRAAGLEAYAMMVTNRDQAAFSMNYLSMGQLDDEIAIVRIDGKEEFFDPGSRYCTFGQLKWTHTLSAGLRQSAGGTVIAQTPGFGYEDAQTIRVAQLELAADGKLKGVIKVKLTGPAALFWRQRALRTDEAAMTREFDEEMQKTVPAGIEVKTNHVVSLADWKTGLTIVLDVTGSMGTASSKRIFLPSSFFEASEKPRFVHDKRENPVDLHYASVQQDTVNLTLPPGFTLENTPKDLRLPLAKNAMYVVKYTTKPSMYSEVRLFVLANPYYEPKDYPDLKDFYQKVNAQDQQQTVLTFGTAASGQ